MEVPAVKVQAILAALAVLLAAGSCSIQRHGPDHAIYCSLGKSQDGFDIYCPKPVLNGGWPAPFAFDTPGISVEGKITVLEDDFRLWPFLADVAFYQLILLSLLAVARRWRQRT